MQQAKGEVDPRAFDEDSCSERGSGRSSNTGSTAEDFSSLTESSWDDAGERSVGSQSGSGCALDIDEE